MTDPPPPLDVTTNTGWAKRTATAAGAPVSAAAGRRLRGLRLRMTLLITALASVIVATFAVAVIRLDRDLRDEQLDAGLLRRVEQVSRLLAFDGGELAPISPAVLGDDVAVGIEPVVDIIEVFDDRNLWSRVPQPDDAVVLAEAGALFDELNLDVQDELLGAFVDFDGDREVRVEALLADPPDVLTDEALRGLLTEAAADAGVDLSDEVVLTTGPEAPLPAEELTATVEAVLADEADGLIRTSTASGPRWIRATVVRDGLEARGAVVAVADPGASGRDHDELRTRVLAVAIVLVVVGAAAGWVVADRTTRPVAVALAQQERFLADAAHELRTPIAAIRATAEGPAGDGTDAARRLQRVAALAASASTMADDLLTLARMDAERMELRTEATRLDLLVEAVVNDHPAVRVDAEEVVARVDPALMARAVDNLVRNALDHGGATAASPVEVGVGPHGVTVADSGPGLPEGVDVFARFGSGSASSGHGLGLPLAQWIAHAHGGDLFAERSATGGARFELQLPTD